MSLLLLIVDWKFISYSIRNSLLLSGAYFGRSFICSFEFYLSALATIIFSKLLEFKEMGNCLLWYLLSGGYFEGGGKWNKTPSLALETQHIW